MTRIVNIQGKKHAFPDDATDDEIEEALNLEKGDLRAVVTPNVKDLTNILDEKSTVGRNLTDELVLEPIADSIPFYKDSSFIAGGLFLLVILIAIFLLRKMSPSKLAIFNSFFLKILIISVVMFSFWMFRYEVTATHPHQCLDRWNF
jgi:hypothetical protein